jgi:hypothetical protein
MQLSFGVYELHLSEEEQEQFSSESEGFLTKVLAEEGAPAPNEIIVHRASDDRGDGLIEELIHQLESMTTSPGHAPPAAAIYHEEVGAHPSRYITIIVQPH